MKLKGHLRPLILKLLEENSSMTGSELVDEVNKRTGKKPSYGSIYPLLKDFREKELVRTEKDGRQKKYWLTEKGEEALGKVYEGREEVLETVMNVFQIYNTIFGTKTLGEIKENVERRKEDINSIRFPELFDLFEVLLQKDFDEDEVKEIRARLSEILERAE